MSKPVILLDAGQLVGLSGTADGDVLTWNGTAWVSSPGGGVGTVTSITAGTGLLGGTITTSGTISMPNVGTAASYGSASSVPVFTTDAQGRVSAVTDTSIGISTAQVTGLDTALGTFALKTTTVSAGTGLSGGGDLSANRTISMPNVGTASSYGSASSVPVITTDAQGRVFSVTPTAIAIAQSQVANLVNDLAGKVPTTTEVIAGTGLSGGGALSGNVTLSLPNVGTQGEYGSASSVAVVTTDAQGRVSSATTTAIAITQSQVADLVTDLGNKADKSVTATAGTGLTGGGTLGANFSFALDTVGTAASNQGSASKTVTISTDAYGRVTALSEQDIGGLAASVISSGQLGLARGGTGIDASGVTGGQVLVGGTGVLALQSVSGDASLASNGAMTVTRLQGNAVSATALGAPDAGKALIWSGSEWQASTIQGGGGGGGLTFFMNYAASSPYPMSSQFDENAGWDTGAITVANNVNGTALGTFVTAVGTPAVEVIPAGLWDVNFYAQSSDGVNSTAVRVKVATLTGATQTVIATSDWVYLSDPSAVVGYSASVYVPLTDVALTDRVEIIFEGRRFVSPAQTITLHFGTDSITHAHTTISAPGGTGLLKVVDGFLQSPATLLVNADVDAAAAIAVAKLAAGTDTYVLTTVSGVPTWSPSASGGVSSLAGTAGQVLVGGTTGSPQTGALTLTLPQSIGTGSSPTFAGLTLDTFSGLLRATAGVLAGGASVSLTAEVTGALPILNGGTNLTASGASGNLLVSDGSAWASVPMTGDASIASTGAMTLKNTGSAGTYGSASAVPVFVTDPQGRVTGVTNTTIAVSGSNFGSQAANTVFAAPDGLTGTPTFRPLLATDIPSLSATYLPIAGGTLTGKLITPASTTVTAGLNLPQGAAPTSPTNGDVWTTSASLFVRINGVTQQFGVLGVSNTWTSTNSFSASTLSFGTSALAGTISLGTGSTASGLTKAINIGTGGLAGSTTTIGIGATAGTSTTTLNGTVTITNKLAVSNLAAGTDGYVLTMSSSVPTWSPASGVTSITGTANQVLVGGTSGSAQTGALTLTLPQSIGTGSSPTFAGLTLNGNLKGDSNSLVALVPTSGNSVFVRPAAAATPTQLTISGGLGLVGGTAGASLVLAGGDGNTALNGNGGNAYLQGGNKTTGGSGADGAVYIGDTNTLSVNIGNSSITTTLNGTVSFVSSLKTTSGGTGISSYTKGDLLTYTSGTALTAIADVALGSALISGGTAELPSWGKIGLTTHVNGTLGVGNGGTGVASLTSNAILIGGATVGALTGSASGQLVRWNNNTAVWTATALLGTTNQITVTSDATSTTLSLPQSIGTGSSPSFTGLTVSGLSDGFVKSSTGVLSGGNSVSLTSDVSGILPTANGGSGVGTASFPAINTVFAGASSGSTTLPTFRSLVAADLPLVTIAKGGTNNASLSVALGTVYYGDGSKLLGLAPGTLGQVLQAQGSAAPQWAGVPYDLSAASAGTYTNGQVIFRYIAPRPVTITSTGSYFKCLTASSGTVTVAVAQSGSLTTSFNVTFSVLGGTSGSVPTGTTITMAAGDVLTVTMPASADTSLAGVYFTLKGTGV